MYRDKFVPKFQNQWVGAYAAAGIIQHNGSKNPHNVGTHDRDAEIKVSLATFDSEDDY
jgi:hypothetical protein